MRLIDAELFKKQVAAMTIRNGYIPEKANALCELIDSQPTAFDVGKVVEQLETKKTRDTELKKKYISEYFKGKADAFEFAIKIVKGGGVE